MPVYTLNLAFSDDLDLSVEFQDMRDLVQFYDEQLKGDSDWLIDQLRAAVGGAENGKSVRTAMRSLNGSVVSVTDERQDQTATSASPPVTSSASSTQTAPRSDDPWGGSSAPSEDQDTSDPWGGSSQPKSAPQEKAQSRPAASAPSGGVKTSRDKYEREWTTGLPEAPSCDCDIPSARVKAKSQKGKWYTVFKCAKAAPGGDWKQKCEFSQFPD